MEKLAIHGGEPVKKTPFGTGKRFGKEELSNLEAALNQNTLFYWKGNMTKTLCKKFADMYGAKHCVATSSGTASIHVALGAVGVGPGDEVIVPAYTYTATASVVRHVGATVVMVDSQKDCVEMDYGQLENAITERTKVIVPVDLGGIVADYEKVYEIVNRPDIVAKFKPKNEIQRRFGRIVVSADCAHSFGASRHNKMAGAIADFSSFSFHAVKNFTTAEGGALTWNIPFGCEPVVMDADSYIPTVEGETWNEYLYRLCQLFSLHGQNKDALAKTKLGAWEYDIIGPWYKCNMTDIAAAIGLKQLERYEGMLARRKEIIGKYDATLKPLGVQVLDHYTDTHASSGHLYLTRIPGITAQQRNDIIIKMADAGIACNVHYKPLPMHTAYKNLGFKLEDYPNAYAHFANEITLPLHTQLTDEQVAYVAENYVEILKEYV